MVNNFFPNILEYNDQKISSIFGNNQNYILGTYYAFGGLFKQVQGTEAYAFTRSDWENFEFGINAGFEGQPPPPDYAGDDVPMLDYLNSLPESIAFMCTVVLRGYEVYIIGGRNDYGTINHFLSNDLPPKNIHHLLLTSEVMMGFRVSKINLRKNGFIKKIFSKRY